jgi:hypothetical protein
LTQRSRSVQNRPQGPPPPPPKPTLTKRTEALDTLERHAVKSKGTRSRRAQSNASLDSARRVQIRNATHSHLAQAGHYMAPTNERPPAPTRTSSLRRKRSKKASANRTYLDSSDPLPDDFQQSYEA